MPRTVRRGRITRNNRRARRTNRAPMNRLFMENFPLPCAMSSVVNNFPFSYDKITPTLANSPRTVNLVRLNLEIPPVTTAGIVQLLLIDPVDQSLFPITTGKQMSTTLSTRLNVSIPRRFMRFFSPNSNQNAFILTFRFTSNQTFTINVMAKMFFSLVPDSIITNQGRAEEFDLIDESRLPTVSYT